MAMNASFCYIRYTMSIVIVLSGILCSCRTWDELPVLEYNRWVEQVPNVIRIDSTRVRAVDSNNAEIRVYFNFDRSAFEAEWDEVETINFSFKDITDLNNPDSLVTDVFLYESGAGLAIPEGTATEHQYQMQHRIILKNGRHSLWSATFKINTPSF